MAMRNSQIALIFYFINLLLGFYSRATFIKYLGTELLGLNSTIVNLVGLLNIAELGIGLAILSSLYTPLYNNDKKSINEIISVQGYWYGIIGIVISIIGIVILCFFSFIFKNVSFPIIYAYLSFIVVLFGSLCSYFFNYKQTILSANQEDYIVVLNYQGSIAIKRVLQIIAIILSNNGYIWWLIIEFVGSLIVTLSLNFVIHKKYPWLSTKFSQGKKLSRQYPYILSQTKKLFIHKISSVVLLQLSPLVIYAYSSLEAVALYGNYMLIISSIIALLNSIFNSINAGIGNLVAEGDKEKIINVFWELFSLRFFIVTTSCIGVYYLSDAFISIWIGSEYLLNKTTLILLIFILYINTMRSSIDSYIYAYGLFSDIWAPLTEIILNIGLSVLLGHFWGMNGVLLGVCISLFILIFCWKPYFCFHKGLNVHIRIYTQGYLKHIICALIATYITHFAFQHFFSQDYASSNIVHWLISCISICGIYAGILLALMILWIPSSRLFFKRIAQIYSHL